MSEISSHVTGWTQCAYSLARRSKPAITLLPTVPRFLATTLLALLLTGGAQSSVAQSQQAAKAASASEPSQVTEAFRSSPVMFIENVDQFDERARFQVRGGPGTMWLTDDAIWITLGAHELGGQPLPP